MQMAHVYVHSVLKESRRSEKASGPNSPARSARLCLGQSNGLESHANTVSVHIHTRREMQKLESICERVSNTELAYQECSSRIGGAKKAQRPNGRIRHMRTRAGPREQLEKVYKQTRMRQDTQRRLYKIKLTWYKPRTHPAEPEARGPRECIGHRHGHAQLPI